MQDSTPMILFVGQIERGMREREAFQELDYRAVFGPMVKWATEIDDPARIPELISRAFHVATSGRPGPVVMALPEDMLTEAASVADAPRYEALETHPGLTQMAELQKLLWAAERPIVLVGGSRWSEAATQRFARFVERFQLPVTATFRRQMLISHDHPSYIGDLGLGVNPKLLARIKDADLVLLLGGRLSEIPSQAYTLLDIPVPRQTLVHVHPGFRRTRPRLSPASRDQRVAHRLLGGARRDAAPEQHPLERAHAGSPCGLPGLEQSRAGPHAGRPADGRGDGAPARGAAARYRVLQRGRQFRDLDPPLLALPGLRHPARADLGLHGLRVARGRRRQAHPAGPDGGGVRGRRRHAHERAGIRHRRAIRSPRARGGNRQRHVRHHPHAPGAGISRPRLATALKNPDFAAYARAFGGYGERVERTEEFAPALERARASGQPAILHCLIDPETISPSTTLTAIREKALAGKG
jgi:acetolactate synthase-1/2/3 large subunit